MSHSALTAVQDIGGDEAAHHAAAVDLQAIAVLRQQNIPRVMHGCMAVIDFRGHRLVVQTAAPGVMDVGGV